MLQNPITRLLVCLLFGFLLTLAMPAGVLYLYVTDFWLLWDIFDSPGLRTVLLALPFLAAWAFWDGFTRSSE